MKRKIRQSQIYHEKKREAKRRREKYEEILKIFEKEGNAPQQRKGDYLGYELIEMMIEDFLSKHPNYSLSESEFYAIIYVEFHYGWEFRPPKRAVFLYNRMSDEIRYSRVILKNKVEVLYEEIGSSIIEEFVFIEDMLDYKVPDLPHVYDGSSFLVYVKSGARKRTLGFSSEYKDRYIPYRWLFKLFYQIEEQIP